MAFKVKEMKSSIKAVSYILIIIITLSIVIPFSYGCSKTEDNRFLELLKLLPESAQAARCFSIIDYEKIWQDYGVSLITTDGNTISQQELLRILDLKIKDAIKNNDLGSLAVLTLGSIFTDSGLYILTDPNYSIQKEYVGYDLTNIKAEINIALYPGKLSPFEYNAMIAAIGQFDQANTVNALKNQNEWPSWEVDSYQTENYEGIVINSWGDSSKGHPGSSFQPARLDIWGRAKPFAVSDNHLFVGRSVDDIKSMIDSSKNKSRSLADVPKYALAAKSIYELGVFGATLADESYTNQTCYWNSNPSPLLKHFISLATGPGKDEKGNYYALVLVHSNNELAQENISLLKQQISKLYVGGKLAREIITDETITVKSTVLLAKFYTTSTEISPVWFLPIGTTLLAHE